MLNCFPGEKHLLWKAYEKVTQLQKPGVADSSSFLLVFQVKKFIREYPQNEKKKEDFFGEGSVTSYIFFDFGDTTIISNYEKH